MTLKTGRRLAFHGPWVYDVSEKSVEGRLLLCNFWPSGQERPADVGWAVLVEDLTEARDIAQEYGPRGLWQHPRARQYVPEDVVPLEEMRRELEESRPSEYKGR